jgi:DNA helicase II / ATP-dependent DNA helicase PcrA
MADLFSELNPQQREAVAASPGPIIVLAGPGSGKTRVLTYRIAYLIAVLEIPAYQIMAVTFTNKAAREMSHRVQGLLGEKADGLWIGTFHAICGRILRREAEHLPVDANFVIYDADDQMSLVKRVIKEIVYNDKDYNPRQVLARISNAKNDLLGPEDYPPLTYRDETIKAIYTAYQRYLVTSNAMDFDDMLLYTANLLETKPEIRQKYARRFKHILVDEFQDTNQAQYYVLFHLASHHHNIFVVGDEDQSIYRWRGADYRNVQRFTEDFPTGGKILLEQNYRSTQTILDTAVAVINENPHRTEKSLFTDRGKGQAVIAYEAADDTDEAAYVVDTIARQVLLGQAQESDFAVMYRTNAQSRLLEEAFRRANMSYRLVGAQRFYGRREVKDIIAFLRLIYNPKDEVSLNRVINLPPRGIGAVTLEKLQTCAQQAGVSSGEVLLSLNNGTDKAFGEELGSAAARLQPFSQLLAGWRKNMADISLTDLFDQVLLDTGYEAHIKAHSDELQDRWANVLELRGVLLEYEDRGLAEFLEAMALVADQDTLPDTIDAPTLLTLHAAKGLEFKQVFIIGLDEYYLPHSRSRDEPEELAEECRLFYVGITRAEDCLYLVRALRRRSPYGSYETMQPSRFLLDIPDELIKGHISRSFDYQDSYEMNPYQWDRPYSRNPKAKVTKTSEARTQRFYPDMHVQHPVYGTGVVQASRLEYGDETVEVYFEGLGLKALVASLSNLTILEG